MAFVLADRVRETSTTVGTGNYTLAGAVSGFRTFASGIGSNTTTYVATMGSQWEVAMGVVSGSSLSRGTILASSNGGAAVNWTTGTKDIRCDAVSSTIAQMYLGAVRWGGTSAGTNTLTITPSPAVVSYATGLTIAWIAGGTNTGSATINVNGLGAISLVRQSGAALAASDVVSGNLYVTTLTAEGSARLINPVVVSSGGGGGGDVDSVFGRTGAVVANSGDYNAGQILETSTRVFMTSSERTKLSSGVITSVFGRSGPGISQQSGDYNAEQISETSARKLMTSAERTKLAGLSSSTATTTLRASINASGSGVSFTGITSDAKILSVMFNSVSTDITASMFIRLGDSGGLDTTNYTSLVAQIRDTENILESSPSSFIVSNGQGAGALLHGVVRFTLATTGNVWVCDGQLISGGSRVFASSGLLNLASTLTQLRIFPNPGSLNAGTISLMIET